MSNEEDLKQQIKLERDRQKEYRVFMEQQCKILKETIQRAAENAFTELHCAHVHHIESDAWMNYRQQMQNEVARQAHREVTVDDSAWGWARKIRDAIFEEHRDELVKMLDQDNLKKIAELQNEIESQRKNRYY